MEITFITSHAKKAEEISRYLSYPVSHQSLELQEIQSLDPRVVVSEKAKEAYRMLRKPVLVEDFSLTFAAFGTLPGPLIKWFLQELSVEGICRLLDAYPSRSAQAQTSFGYCDEDGLALFGGIIDGTIALQLRGKNGYGTDGIFIPNGQSKTWGEMNATEQARYSLRRIGLEKLDTFLATKSRMPR